ADRVGETLPQRQPAFTVATAVMVDDPVQPEAAEARILRLREDERVLDGNARLIVVAVGDPGAQLRARQVARGHRAVKRVPVVVAASPFRSQALDELFGPPRLGVAHDLHSKPSCATSMPSARSATRSGPSSTSSGLVLLTCTNHLRRAPK